MNYYEHWLGDYVRDTAHLSMVEDGAYRRLLDAYYLREKPLPVDVKECCKLARAITKAERDAVAYVLREFFDLQVDGHHQGRADIEIVNFADRRGKAQGKAKAAAAARWGTGQAPGNGCSEHAASITQALHDECLSNALQSPVPSPQEEQEQKPSAERVSRKARKRTLPPDFSVDDDLGAYATARLPDVDLAGLVESFTGKAKAKGWEFVNWRQAFQEFVRNVAPNSGHWASGQYPKKAQHRWQ